MWFRNQHVNIYLSWFGGFPGGAVVKNLPANAGDTRDSGLIPGRGKYLGGNGNPLQYSCLENSMDPEVWGATVHRVTKSQTRLSDSWLSALADYDAVTPLDAHCKTLDRTLLFLKGHLLSQFFGILPDLDLNVIIAREFQHFPCC